MNKTILKNILRELLIFIIGICVLLLFWKNNIIVTILILIIYIIRTYFWNLKGDIILFITGAILGTVAEIIATHIGIWQYANPSFLNIPLWLPFAWGFVAVLIIRISQNFIEIKN